VRYFTRNQSLLHAFEMKISSIPEELCSVISVSDLDIIAL
jgi:hypothetical protein